MVGLLWDAASAVMLMGKSEGGCDDDNGDTGGILHDN